MAVTYQPWRSGSVLGLRQIHVASHVFFSQNGQDQWIYENILKRSTNGRGVFLEAGAVDGVTNSNTLFFERSLGWNGVCIEPSPESFKELQVLRPGCDTKNLAIGGLTKSGTASFVVGSGGNSLCSQRGFLDSSDSSDEKLRKNCGSVTSVEVAVVPFAELLYQLGLKRLELLSLDLEGAELEVLQSIDFSVISITSMIIENNEETPNGARGRQIQDFLESKGFSLVASIAQDDIYLQGADAWTVSMLRKQSRFESRIRK
mmetsp:Transcript_33747/g.52535  ORF Transcript_33747/g.52535 Transcript_33747/m.52535 type:complete len:260 (-) Transcript_33747:24-803(-)